MYLTFKLYFLLVTKKVASSSIRVFLQILNNNLKMMFYAEMEINAFSFKSLSNEIRPKIKLSSLHLRKRRGGQIFFCWKPSKSISKSGDSDGFLLDFAGFL